MPLITLDDCYGTHWYCLLLAVCIRILDIYGRAVFDACSCGRSVLRCGKIENFLSLQKRNRLLHPHASNADRVNQP